MKGQLSEPKKRFILLTFTKELIRHSETGEFLKLKDAIKEKLKVPMAENLLDLEEIFEGQSQYSEKRMLPNSEILPLSQPIISEEKEVSGLGKIPKEKSIISKEKLTRTIEIDEAKKPGENLVNILRSGRFNKSPQIIQPMRRGKMPVLRIPKQTLPPKFGYLKPISTKREIDLGRLNPLVNDPLVKNIECNGAGKNIIVEGSMGRKETAIILDRKEIDEIIDRFSKAGKIPVSEGIFRVVFGRFTFSAIISEVISPKFIIRKTAYLPFFRRSR